MDNIDKVFYTAGDLVQIKHPMPFKPIMLVKGKETKTIKGAEGAHFLGIKCVWFTTTLEYQENIFSTKDLEHYKPELDPYSTEYAKLKDKPKDTDKSFFWEEIKPTGK